MLIHDIIGIFFLLLPAAFANMSPVLFKKVNILNVPVDFGLKFRKKRIFGKNKTIRGVFFATIIAIIITLMEHPLLNYKHPVTIGFLLGMGAMLGDLIESFFKRQIGIKPGGRFIPFDQTDWVIGSYLLVSLEIGFSWYYFFLSILLFFVLHVIVKHISYLLGFEKTRW